MKQPTEFLVNYLFMYNMYLVSYFVQRGFEKWVVRLPQDLLMVFQAQHKTAVHLRMRLILQLLKVHQRNLYLLQLSAAHTHEYHIKTHEAK